MYSYQFALGYVDLDEFRQQLLETAYWLERCPSGYTTLSEDEIAQVQVEKWSRQTHTSFYPNLVSFSSEKLGGARAFYFLATAAAERHKLPVLFGADGFNGNNVLGLFEENLVLRNAVDEAIAALKKMPRSAKAAELRRRLQRVLEQNS